ncbi:MAG: hypothetical protein L0241_20525, partial [Planctomycetia bacterium]|nr:hypothetical protein [Planctomycetia bacterium]
VTFSTTQRGFFNFVWVDNGSTFLKHADTIFNSAPVTHVGFTGLTAEEARDLIKAGHLARLRELSLDNEVEPEAVRRLGSHRDASAIRKLEIIDPLDATETVEALADGKHWTGLECLDISDLEDCMNPPDMGYAADLFGRKQFRNLRKLIAWACNLDNDAVKAIARNMPELRYLDAAINRRITGKGAIALAESKSLSHLRWLNISNCSITSASATAAVINSAKFPNLTVLQLSSNFARGPDVKELAKPGRGASLRILTLGSSEFTEAGFEALAKCPAIRGVWYLDLESTHVTDEALEKFVKAAAFDHLVYLDLSGNDLTSRGARTLAAWPGAERVQWLDLSGNKIEQSGAKAIAASEHLRRLKFIHATGRGTALLKKRFKKAFG